jgi:hypothetical protein
MLGRCVDGSRNVDYDIQIGSDKSFRILRQEDPTSFAPAFIIDRIR